MEIQRNVIDSSFNLTETKSVAELGNLELNLENKE